MLQHEYLKPRTRFVVSIRHVYIEEKWYGRFGELPQVAEARAGAGLATVSPEPDTSRGDAASRRRKRR